MSQLSLILLSIILFTLSLMFQTSYLMQRQLLVLLYNFFLYQSILRSIIFIIYQLRYFDIMFYAIPAFFGFGGGMYYLGRSQSLDDPKKDQKESTPKPEASSSSHISSTKQSSFAIQKTALNENAVTSILRNLTLNPHCKILYSTYHKTPIYVHQLLTFEVITGNAKRHSGWIVDKSIEPQKFAVSDSFYKDTQANKNFGFDRGHMAASANYSSDQTMRKQTNKLSNIIPQNAFSNQGIWGSFEDYCRAILKTNKCDSVEVISGPIFNSGIKTDNPNIYKTHQLVLKENGIVVPPRLYKIIKCNTKSGSYASGFTFSNKEVAPNTPRNDQEDFGKLMGDFEEPIQQIENQTGLVFNFKKQVSSLTDFDSAQFKRTLKSHIQSNFQESILQGQDIEELNDRSRLASFMSIDLEQSKEKLSSKIKYQCTNQLKAIEKESRVSECEKLEKLLKLHKIMFYLNTRKGILSTQSRNLEKQINSLIAPCIKKGTGETKDQVIDLLNRAYKKSRFTSKDLLENEFFKIKSNQV